MMRKNDFRARQHSGWWAFLVHRISGLMLAVFLPLHFWVLSQALQGPAAFDQALSFADQPIFKLGEWGLVVLLSLHMMGGVRLLLMEFGTWSGPRKNWIAATAGFGLATGMAFALALIA
jgi:fumarate reductase subunit D